MNRPSERRNIFMRPTLIVALSALAFLQIACSPTSFEDSDNHDNEKPAMTNNRGISFSLNDNGDDVVANADVPVQRSAIAGALLYSARDIQFHLRAGPHSIQFPAVRSLLFFDTAEDPGIGKIVVKLPAPRGPVFETTASENVIEYERWSYETAMSLLSSIRKAGWERYIPLEEARLEGAASYPISLLDSENAWSAGFTQWYMDDTYTPTFEEWSSMTDSVRWLWIADDTLLHFNYMRAPRTPGTPLADRLEIEIETAASITGASHPDEHTRQEFLATLDAQLAERTRKERIAWEAGLPIDTSYQNPTIAGLQFPATP